MLNHAEIALLLAELLPLQGAVVQKVSQSAPEELSLALRRPGETALLSFRLQRGNPRFLLVPHKSAALGKAPAFTMVLRKYLGGARLQRMEQPEGERIARFVFRKNEKVLILVAELVPPGGNLLLLAEDEKILARLFNDERNGTVGRVYVPPAAMSAAGGNAASVRTWTGDSFHQFLAAQETTLDPAALAAEERELLLRRSLAKRDKLSRHLDEDWKRAGEPEEWKRRGELLQHAGVDTLGQTVVQAVDPDNGQAVRLEVNPALTTKENIAAFFKRARRAESARVHIAARRKLLDEPEVPASAPAPAGRSEKKSASTDALTGIPAGHVYRFPGGSLVVAGRSATENETVTYRWAGGEDYWLHARDVPGSHVVVRHAAGDELESVLDDAARLALNYSFKRGEPQGDVILTRRKYVQRIRGAPGKVKLVKEENRRVEVTPDDLTRLESFKLSRK